MRPIPVRPPIIRVHNGTFYRHHPSSHPSSSHRNRPLFTNLSFELPSTTTGAGQQQNWCVVGPSLSGKTTFLQVLRGQHLSIPPTARSFPYLSTDAVPHHLRSPGRAIQYVGFDAGMGSGLGPATSAYLAARYESLRENTDFSLRDFLLGNTQLNPADSTGEDGRGYGRCLDARPPLEQVVRDLHLEPLLDLPVAFLSNGQGRRARIARALLKAPEVLLLDEPFMGLDPPTVSSLSPLLSELAGRAAPRLVLSARPQDPLPEWISHLVYLRTDCQVGRLGPREEVLEGLRGYVEGVARGKVSEDPGMPVSALREMGKTLTAGGIVGSGFGEVSAAESVAFPESLPKASARALGEPIVEMDGCQVRYGDKVVLGNWQGDRTRDSGEAKKGLVWTVRRGERWGVFGPNGSGKTTIVSLLCSDHPQTYSLPIRLFGRSRLPEPGPGELPLTFWDIQSLVGHSSPEIHQHMPRSLSIRRVVENAWADTFLSRPKMDERSRAKVEAALRWFEHELNPNSASASTANAAAFNAGQIEQHEQQATRTGSLQWADEYLFGELSFSAQRVLLLLRAIIKNPDIVVLDEAFSGMDEDVRDKCMLFIAHGEEKSCMSGSAAAAVDSHVKKAGKVRVTGLSDRQAFICISHVREEVPDFVREWLCLPEANSGLRARFGQLDGPLRLNEAGWNDIWGVRTQT